MIFQSTFFWGIIAFLNSVSAWLYSSCRPSFYFIDRETFTGASVTVLILMLLNAVGAAAMLIFVKRAGAKFNKVYGIVSIVLSVIFIGANVAYAFLGWEMWMNYFFYIKQTAVYFFVFWAVIASLIIIPKAKGKAKAILSIVLASVIFVSCIFSGFQIRKFEFSAQPVVFIDGDDNYTVTWATSCPSTGTLEICKDGLVSLYYDENCGTVEADTRVHNISIARKYLDGCDYYRVISKHTIGHTGYSLWEGKTINSEKYQYKTLAYNETDFNIWSFSDWHEHSYFTESIMQNFSKADFFIMLGDALNMIACEDDIITNILAPCGKISGSEIPVLFARGNHECRGAYATKLLSVLGLSSYYNTYSIGPVAGVILDNGESDVDKFVEYWGTADYETYRDREGEWLSKAKIDDKPYKIAICHDSDFIHKTDERSDRPLWINYLNKMGVDLMLGGHLHNQYLEKPGKDNKEYYTFIDGGIKNGGYAASQITVNGKKVSFKTVNREGNVVVNESADIF